MAEYSFGKTSRSRLDTVHPDLVRVVERALSFGIMDISIIEGNRSIERQQELFHDGKSEIDGVNRLGKHNHLPSLAVDIMPYPAVVNGVNVWADNQRWNQLSGLMLAAASLEGVDIRWGGDWDGDGNNADSNFNDYPHYELVM